MFEKFKHSGRGVCIRCNVFIEHEILCCNLKSLTERKGKQNWNVLTLEHSLGKQSLQKHKQGRQHFGTIRMGYSGAAKEALPIIHVLYSKQQLGEPPMQSLFNSSDGNN